MVATITFSAFTANPFSAVNNTVGLRGLSNSQFFMDWTTATRPSPPAAGMFGYNTTVANFEYYNGTAWVAFGAATGGVTNIGTGTGLTGGPITSTGTISLAPITNNDLLANTSGISNSPIATTLSTLIDSAIDNTQGDILFRNATVWTFLPPGTVGQVLQTGGGGANPSWSTVGSGTVTQVNSGTGLTGGPITGTGTLSFDVINDATILSNISGGSAVPIPNSLTLLIDYAAGSTQGDILYRDSGAWATLAPSTQGLVLTTNGAAANPSWSSFGLIVVNITCDHAALASAGIVTLITAATGSAQYQILNIFENSGGTNFSGGGGNRLGQVSDGTTVYSVIPAANLQTLVNAGWGSTPVPYPAAAAINTPTVAGASLFFQYSGGSADYTAGSVIITVVAIQVA